MLSTAIRRFIRADRGPLDDFWYRPTASVSAAGIAVNDELALSVSTFWACVRVLSDSVGAMPWHVYQDLGEDDRRRATDYPLYKTLHDMPNGWQTPLEWKAMGVGHLLLRGNFYCRIDAPSSYSPYPSFVPLNPDRMDVKQTTGGAVSYLYKYLSGDQTSYRQDQILHVKLLTLDGLKGMRPLEYAKETLGMTISQQQYAGSLFKNGGFLKYYLKTTKRLGAEGRRNFREGWRDLHGDPSKFEPPILEDDMDIKTLGMTQEDAQWLESRKFGAYEVCQFLGVPPHLVFLLDRATYSNIEQQSLEFLTIHLNPWLVRFEQTVAPLLDDTYYSEFLRDSIVRGDIASRYEAYSKALQGRPFMVPNDVRRKENMPPVDGWDKPIDPLNMAAPGAPGEQGRQPPPQQEEEEDEPEARRFNLQPIIADAARRIVARELVAMKARGPKASESPAAFARWAGEWYGQHLQFARDQLAPIATAYGNPLALRGWAGEYCERSAEAICEHDKATTLADWEANKAADITQQIERILACTTTF
jgi:HK97 family phage portal protein